MRKLILINLLMIAALMFAPGEGRAFVTNITEEQAGQEPYNAPPYQTVLPDEEWYYFTFYEDGGDIDPPLR